MSSLDYIAFFCAVRHTDENEKYLIEMLKNYDIGSYLIVRETSPVAHKDTDGDHYHFLVQMKSDDWGRFRKRVFIDHFKLRGQAKSGLSRQYGKVNYLKDPERMAIYMLKDNSVVESTFTDSQLQSWYKQSYSKSESVGLKEKLVIYVKQRLSLSDWYSCDGLGPTDANDIRKVFFEICELYVMYYREHNIDKTITKSQLSNFANYYMIYHITTPSTKSGYIFSASDIAEFLLFRH